MRLSPSPMETPENLRTLPQIKHREEKSMQRI